MSDKKISRLSSGNCTKLRGFASDLQNPSQTLNEQSPVSSLRNRKSKEIHHA
ncbi:MAG: hypothetical protein Q7K57_59545 [Burkholderiaceae bacterium]|nr:hypothetical protein [Burkholderiaceae bacterium]